MELLFEGVGRETSVQQGAVGNNSLLMVDKGYTIDPSRSIEAEYHINSRVVQPLTELRPAGTPRHAIRNLFPQLIKCSGLLQGRFRSLVIALQAS